MIQSKKRYLKENIFKILVIQGFFSESTCKFSQNLPQSVAILRHSESDNFQHPESHSFLQIKKSFHILPSLKPQNGIIYGRPTVFCAVLSTVLFPFVRWNIQNELWPTRLETYVWLDLHFFRRNIMAQNEL